MRMDADGARHTVPGCGADADFEGALAQHGLTPLRRVLPRTLQVNVGKLCNQACHHCHVEAGPRRAEIMPRATAERVVAVLRSSPCIHTVDVTGGAPELNPSFRWLVAQVRALGRHVMVRCNLTVLFEPGMEALPQVYREHGVELVCSLPCYTPENVERQRGGGVFEKSVRALQCLNEIGYGLPRSPLRLHLVYNPLGAFLPPQQAELEARYRDELRRHCQIEFHSLLTITNMPIKRFAEQLQRSGSHAEYMALLVNHFNPSTVAGLMCRTLVSVGWDGALYDCDFNQMLELPVRPAGVCGTRPLTVWDVEQLDRLTGNEVRVGAHCFGCTAGAGSSCGGALQ